MIYDMTKGDPIKEILRFAFPMLIGNVFQQVYSMVDTMVAGYVLGDQAIAAIGVTASLYSFLLNFAIGMNNGSALVLTRSIGMRDEKGIRKNIVTMVILNVVIVAGLICLSMVFLNAMCGLAWNGCARRGICDGSSGTVRWNVKSGISYK